MKLIWKVLLIILLKNYKTQNTAYSFRKQHYNLLKVLLRMIRLRSLIEYFPQMAGIAKI